MGIVKILDNTMHSFAYHTRYLIAKAKKKINMAGHGHQLIPSAMPQTISTGPKMLDETPFLKGYEIYHASQEQSEKETMELYH